MWHGADNSSTGNVGWDSGGWSGSGVGGSGGGAWAGMQHNQAYYQSQPAGQVDWAMLAQQWIQNQTGVGTGASSEASGVPPPLPPLPPTSERSRPSGSGGRASYFSDSGPSPIQSQPPPPPPPPIGGVEGGEANMDIEEPSIDPGRSWQPRYDEGALWKNRRHENWQRRSEQWESYDNHNWHDDGSWGGNEQNYWNNSSEKYERNHGNAPSIGNRHDGSNKFSSRSLHQEQHHQHHGRYKGRRNVPSEQEHHSSEVPVANALDAESRKKLPAWIRQGLEKMEQEKLKKEELVKRKQEMEERERSKRLKEEYEEKNKNDGRKSKFESDSGESESEEETSQGARKENLRRRSRFESDSGVADPSNESPRDAGSHSSTPELMKSREEILQEMMITLKRTLTEVLLEVTNEELASISSEVLGKAKHRNFFEEKPSGLALAVYNSSESEASDSDEELKNRIKQKKKSFESVERRIRQETARSEADYSKRESIWLAKDPFVNASQKVISYEFTRDDKDLEFKGNQHSKVYDDSAEVASDSKIKVNEKDSLSYNKGRSDSLHIEQDEVQLDSGSKSEKRKNTRNSDNDSDSSDDEVLSKSRNKDRFSWERSVSPFRRHEKDYTESKPSKSACSSSNEGGSKSPKEQIRDSKSRKDVGSESDSSSSSSTKSRGHKLSDRVVKRGLESNSRRRKSRSPRRSRLCRRNSRTHRSRSGNRRSRSQNRRSRSRNRRSRSRGRRSRSGSRGRRRRSRSRGRDRSRSRTPKYSRRSRSRESDSWRSKYKSKHRR